MVLNELGNVHAGVIQEVLVYKVLQFFLIQFSGDIMQLVGRGNTAVQHELDVDHAQTVQVAEIKQVEQDFLKEAYILSFPGKMLRSRG